VRRDPFRDEPIFGVRDSARRGETGHDCFEDEIAIDFPSVGGLVDRAREAFLGDDARESGTVTREVRLSNREARRGTIVPLELPIRNLCRGCGGRGEVCGVCVSQRLEADAMAFQGACGNRQHVQSMLFLSA